MPAVAWGCCRGGLTSGCRAAGCSAGSLGWQERHWRGGSTGAHTEHTRAHLGQEVEGCVLGVHQPVGREAVGCRPLCVEADVPRLGLLLEAEQPAAQAAAPTAALAATGEEAVGLGLHLPSELHLPTKQLVPLRRVLEGVVWRFEAGHGRASDPGHRRRVRDTSEEANLPAEPPSTQAGSRGAAPRFAPAGSVNSQPAPQNRHISSGAT